jgi:hypothetical protein
MHNRAASEAPMEHVEPHHAPKPQDQHDHSPSPVAVGPPVNIPAPKPHIPQPTVLEFATKEQAEDAFIDLLRKTVSFIATWYF